VKADILTLFNNNSELAETAEGLAKRIGCTSPEAQKEIEDLVELGILNKSEVYTFVQDRNKEIQDAISKQLILGETTEREASVSAEISRSPTGIGVLDKALPSGMPNVGTMLILSDPGAGHENLLAYFVGNQIGADKSVLYVTLDSFPDNVRQMVGSYITNGKLDWSPLIFIDCYSKAVGLESNEDYTPNAENLSEISVAISDIMAKRKISMLVLDSFNTLVRNRGVRSAVEFLRVFVARTRQAGALSLVTMNRRAFHPAIIASAQDIVDGVIEMKIDETPEGSVRELRILRMMGTKHLMSWIKYDIGDDGTLIDPFSR
jgi:KaiC/GvpD/RAD55 family RecA-like ATPase